MKIAIASSSLVSTDAIESLQSWRDVELVSIFTNPDKASGRGQKLTENQFAQWATSKELKVFKPSDEAELLHLLRTNEIELLITIAYGHILSLPVLQTPKYGCINLHFSLLPKYRGAAPVQWTLLNGETKTGITVFNLDQGMDTGPILKQQIVDIDPDDSTSSLLEKLSALSGDLLKESITAIKSGEKGSPQSNIDVSLAPKILKEAGRINWRGTSASIYNQYRALSENPGIFTELNGLRIRINRLAISNRSLDGKGSGSFIDGKLLIATDDFAVELISVTPEGRKEMSGAAFFNGLQSKAELSFA